MSRLFGGFIIALSVGIAVAIMRVPTSVDGFWLSILWGTWIVTIVWALTRPSFSVLFTGLTVEMLLFVLIPATGVQVSGNASLAGYNYQAGLGRAYEICALAQLGLLAGAMSARTLWPIPRFKRLSPALSSAALDRTARRSVFVAICAILAFSVLAHASLRNFFVYTTSIGYGAFSMQTTGSFGFLLVIECIAGLALVLLPLRLGSSDSSRWFSPVLLALVTTFLLLGGGQRVRFFVPAIAAGLVWLKTSKRNIPPQQIVAVGTLVLVLLGGLVGVAREAAGSRHVTFSTVLAEPFGSGNDLFLPLAGLASTVPGQLPYLRGSSYLQIPIFAVPRALWKSKPQSDISTVITVLDPGNSGLAFPEFGEMYANFGMPGVITGCLILGVLVELFTRRLARSESIQDAVFISVGDAVLLGIFIRGSVAPMLTTFLGLLIATALICRQRSQVLAPVQPPEPPTDSRSRRAGWPVATE